MASLHLVDQATLEMFVALLLDENENTGTDERVFEFLANVDEELSLDEDEPPSCFRKEIQEPWGGIIEADEASIFVPNQPVPGTSLATELSKKHNALNIALYKPVRDDLEKADDSSADSNFQTPPDALELRVDPKAGDAALVKVIRDGGLDYCVLFVKTQGTQTVVKILRLSATGVEMKFKFIYINEKD